MKIGLYRIIGNDLDGRHGATQTIDNVKYILENEKNFSNCSKIWILNRIRDEKKSQILKKEILSAGQTFLEISFDLKEYRKKLFTPHELPSNKNLGLNELSSTDSRLNCIAHIACVSSKSLYLINNNGGRNFALQHGKQHFDWTLPFDGNCYLNEDSFEILFEVIKKNNYAKYLYVPMHRVLDNQYVEKINIDDANDEPQLCFRSDSIEEFNQDIMYGFKPKVELLKRLDIPGPWDDWGLYYPWSKLHYKKSVESHLAFRASYTVRLADGKQSTKIDQHNIALTREESIYQEVRNIDISMFPSISKFDPFCNTYGINKLAILRAGVNLFDNSQLLETAKLNANIYQNLNDEIKFCHLFLLINTIQIDNVKNSDLFKYFKHAFNWLSINLSNRPSQFSFFVSGLYALLLNLPEKQIQDLNLKNIVREYLSLVNSKIKFINSVAVLADIAPDKDSIGYVINAIEVSVAQFISGNQSDAYNILVCTISIIHDWLLNCLEYFSVNKNLSSDKILEMSYLAVLISNFFEIIHVYTAINLWEWEGRDGSLIKKYTTIVCKYYESGSYECDYYSYILFLTVSKNSAYIRNSFNLVITSRAIEKCMNSKLLHFPLTSKND